MYRTRGTGLLADSPISSRGHLLGADILDDLLGVVQREPERREPVSDLGRTRIVAHVVNDLVRNVDHHDASPRFMARRVAVVAMTERHGVSFEDVTYERLTNAAGDGHVSPLVDRYCWFGLEADAELGKRGIIIDDPDDRMEFLLDRLEEALDAWNA